MEITLVVHLVHRIDVKMEEVRKQFIAYGVRILLREKNVVVFLPPKGIVTTIAAGKGADFFPAFMGLAFFSVPSAIDCVAFTPPPPAPPRHPPILTRNHSPGTDSGTQESTFVWKCVICKFFSFFCIRSLVRLCPGSINTNSRHEVYMGCVLC
jgi:hypothetical protein